MDKKEIQEVIKKAHDEIEKSQEKRQSDIEEAKQEFYEAWYGFVEAGGIQIIIIPILIFLTIILIKFGQ